MTPKPDDLVDPRVADTWREASSEEPPASVDAAILAAARREVSARPEALIEWRAREARASRRRWWPLAAAATVAAVAVGLLQLTPSDKIVSPATETATVSDVPSPSAKTDAGAAAPSPAAEPAAPAAPQIASSPAPIPAAKPARESAASTSRPKEDKRARSDDRRPTTEAQKVAPSPPAAVSAAPAEPRQSATASSTTPFPAANQAAADAAAPPRIAKMAAGRAAESSTDDARAKDRKPLPVPDWIALIRRLRAEGKQDEAAKELAAFRNAHPDHEKLLPPDLRDWRPPEK